MAGPLSNILIKVFARGFYKVHSGLLIFLFVAFISYCFFINTAGDITKMPASEALFYNFILLMTFISDPLMTGLFFIAWLLYTVKSWGYIAGQLKVPHHQFVYYSSISFSKTTQFKSWFYTQFIISLPFVFYALVAGITGIVFHHYAMVASILIFTLLLICVSAGVYVKLVNNLVWAKTNSWIFAISRTWKKPLFSLFIYQVFDRLKLGFVITKVISYLIIVSIMFCFADVRNDVRVAGLSILGIVTTHSVLIYQQHRFDLTYLTIARNLPFGIGSRYISYVFNYLLLLLPEIIWVLMGFNLLKSIALIVLMLSIALLFHCLLYKIGLAVNKYLTLIFGLFTLSFGMVLFGLIWLIIPLGIISSFTMFYFNYYKAQLQLV